MILLNLINLIMEKKKLIVSKNVRFIDQWKGYSLENFRFPHILNKVVTGCGYTEYCLRNPLNVILLSPRRALLQNKKDQHPEVHYFKNEMEQILDYEKDVTKNKISKKECFISSDMTKKEKSDINAAWLEKKEHLLQYYRTCTSGLTAAPRPCKILVTYDSFRHVRETLEEVMGVDRFNDEFYIVVDEFQAILGDARFKASTEIEVLNSLAGLQKVCYVSATPILDKYLDMLDEFKDLPYYELDWETEEPGRIQKPLLDVKFLSKSVGLVTMANRIVRRYKEEKYDSFKFVDPKTGEYKEVLSKECVMFFNSVTTLTQIIKWNDLLPEDVNVLCAKTMANEKSIRRAFRDVMTKLGMDTKLLRGVQVIGSIPGRGEKHKKITLCTRTVYLGADFYSTNAKTFIFSDPNVNCLGVDVSMDLEQILGRQRLDENPWKNKATLYTKTSKELSKENIDKVIEKKVKKSNKFLSAIKKVDKDEYDALVESYEYIAKSSNYTLNYISINSHGGSNKFPVFNNLMYISELRTFELQSLDYKDRFSVLSAVSSVSDTLNDSLCLHLEKFNSIPDFPSKLKYICELTEISYEEKLDLLSRIVNPEFKCYFTVLGPERCKALSYQRSHLEEEFNRLMSNQGVESRVKEVVLACFKVGQRYTKDYIKTRLREIFEDLDYKKTAKASSLGEWFDIKPCLIINKETGRKEHGFIILGEK